MTPHTDLRRHPRYPFVAPIQVWWQDGRGFQWQDHGYCLDTSEGGLKMELPRALPVNIRINVRLPRLDLNSSVLVRHCTRRSSKFIIGVAFQRTPSEALQAAPAIEDRQQHYPEQDPALESWNAITQPPDDDVRTYFQDLKTRKSGRSASTKARRRMWLRVALAVSGAVGVLFILTLPRLLRYATESYQHPLLQKASAFVEAVVNYGHQKR